MQTECMKPLENDHWGKKNKEKRGERKKKRKKKEGKKGKKKKKDNWMYIYNWRQPNSRWPSQSTDLKKRKKKMSITQSNYQQINVYLRWKRVDYLL